MFMDEPPRKSGGVEVRGEYVMKSTRSEETRMSVLDDYLVDPKISMLAKSLTRNGKDCAIPFHGSISLRIEQASARAIAPKRNRARPHCWRRWPQSSWRGVHSRRRQRHGATKGTDSGSTPAGPVPSRARKTTARKPNRLVNGGNPDSL